MDLISNQISYPKEVFFLGAGTSVLAGVPTFANFREKAEDIFEKKLLNNESNRQFERVLKYWKKNFNECNVEEFYSAVEIHEMLTDKEKKETVTTNEIEKFITTTIKKSINIKNYDDPYGLFIKRVGSSVIITTNWDILLETSRQYHIRDGWISYEFVSPYDKTESEMRDFTSKLQYRILKLHGSLNWGFCKKCDKIYYFEEKVDDGLALSEGIICNNDNCGEKLMRVILPPKLSKLIKPDENIKSDSLKSPYFKLRDIWSRASEYLKMCEKIYFIGYSFPETDVQMKTFISNALRENKKLKEMEIKIISNKKHGNSRIEFEERYLSIFSRFISPSNIEFNYKGFKQFCIELDEYPNRYHPQLAPLNS